jgi:LmbE family N-acetylglucosaminyl deacetylase
MSEAAGKKPASAATSAPAPATQGGSPGRTPRRARRRWPWLLLLPLLLALLAGLMLNARYQNYRALLRYDPDQDFQYNLGQNGGKHLMVEVGAEGLRWPANAEPGDTCFLRLEVRSTWLGQFLDPYLEFEAGGAVYRQYLDREVEGDRYLNLSPLLAAPPQAGQPVALKGAHLAWEPQLAQLSVYASAPSPGARILVIAPHPDDAEIAAFGLYRKRDAYVVTITSGEGGDLFYDPVSVDQHHRRRTKAKLRVWDSLAVPIWAGLSADRSINLGFPDGKLASLRERPDLALEQPVSRAEAEGRLKPGQDRAPRAGGRGPATWNNLVAELAEILRGVAPTAIVAPHPLLDSHPDHVHATLALLEALERAGPRKGRLYLYTNHHVVTEIFPFGPAGSLVGLPPWFKGGWLCESLYSKALDPEVQSEKYFALEAMHDLRASSADEDSPTALLMSGLGKAYEAVFKMKDPRSYYRRAVKANELFFVVGLRLAPRLAQLTLEAMSGGAPRPPWPPGKKKRSNSAAKKNKMRQGPPGPG